MVEAFNKILKQVLRKQPNPGKATTSYSQISLDWDRSLSRIASLINGHVIYYLEVLSQAIIFSQSQEVLVVSTTLLALLD